MKCPGGWIYRSPSAQQIDYFLICLVVALYVLAISIPLVGALWGMHLAIPGLYCMMALVIVQVGVIIINSKE